MLGQQLKRRFATVAPSSSASFYDVVIVGGGLVGNAMACSIGRSPQLRSKKVLILESGKPKSLGQPSLNYSNRVSAVNGSSMELFHRLGIKESLSKYRWREVTDLFVTDSCSHANIHFEQLNRDSPVAYIIENEAIISALYDALATNCPNVSIKAGTNVTSCSIPEDLSENAEVMLSDGTAIETSLLIGADGAKSCVRQSMGVEHVSKEYDQNAIVATLQISPVCGLKNTIAYQRFTPLGPIALLPLTDELSSLVWTSSTEDAERLRSLSEDQFVDELNHYLFTDESQNSSTNQALHLLDKACEFFPKRCVGNKPNLQIPYVINVRSDSRAMFPLSFGYADKLVRSRAALIGDAAHKVHPLAGQGVNLGWGDVKNLTNCLEIAANEGADLGSLIYLRKYNDKSFRHNDVIMKAIDGLNKLYGTSSTPAVFLRSIGVKLLNGMLPMKDIIMHKASN